MNLSSSKTGSSSCQCTTTLYGENEETQKSVRKIQLTLRIILADSRAGIGHFWGLDQGRNGTGDWDRTAERMMINFAESGHPMCSCHQRPGKRRIKKQRKEKEVYSLQWW